MVQIAVYLLFVLLSGIVLCAPPDQYYAEYLDVAEDRNVPVFAGNNRLVF